MLKLLTCRFSNKNILINIDRQLIASIIRNNGELTERSFNPPNARHSIRINLSKLIIAAATIQTRRKNPTSFNKLLDRSDLLDSIRGCDDFCIIKHPDVDKQIRISEDLGVGLSVLVTDHYYKINWTTLGKIRRRRGSKPDIACMSLSNESITIEAKGSTSEGWRSCQRNYAYNQKRGPLPSNVSVASCALLKEDSISDIDYFDPPIIPPEDPKYERALLKADHYARVFNLIGQDELSKYFDYMRQRVLYDRDFEQFDKKEELYRKIKTQYVQIRFGQHVYYGNIEKYGEKSLIFVGVDSRLLNAYSFIHFEGQKDSHFEIEGEDFYLSSDGLCIGLLKSLRLVEGQIRYEQIPHNYDSFSIVDFDYSRESTLMSYLSHAIAKVGGRLQKELPVDSRFDLLFSLNDKMFAMEIKRYINIQNLEKILEMLVQSQLKIPFQLVLVTNTKVSESMRWLFRSRNLILIDRPALIDIIADNKAILDYLR
jgi:hypothetical protein